MILRAGDQRVVLWSRGRHKTFKNYDLDTVGLIEAAPLPRQIQPRANSRKRLAAR